MVNLDTNGDGMVGFVESTAASPVRGNLSSTNQPLNQRFPWPTDSSGNLRADLGFRAGAGHSADDAQLLERASGDQLPRRRRHARDAGRRSDAVVRKAPGRVRARSLHGEDGAARLSRQRLVRARAKRRSEARVRRLHRRREPRLHDEAPDPLRQHQLVQGLVLCRTARISTSKRSRTSSRSRSGSPTRTFRTGCGSTCSAR